MKKKIILVLLCFVAIFSCGKKSNPQYKSEKNTSEFERYIFEFHEGQKYINS